jgi:hypothetical protein
MNMISTGAFLTEMDASNKQPTLAGKFAAVWEKKNAKAARAGGVSLMALSLAACGSDNDSAATTTTTTTTTTTATTPVAVNSQLTVGVDTLSGGAGADTFSGTAGNSEPTLTAGDTISGGDGSDMVLMVATGANNINIAGLQLDSVEKIRVADSSTGGNTTVNLAGQAGITDLESSGSAQTGNINFSNVSAIADLTLSNTSGGGTTTVTYISTATVGTADVQNVHLSTAAQTGDVTIAGVETIAVTSDADSTLALAASSASKVTLAAGATKTTLDLDAAGNSSLVTVDASATTGATTITVDPDLATDGMTVTGGSGADIIDISAGALAQYDTIDGGDGADTVRVQSSAATYASAAIAGSLAVITNVEALELEADHNAAANTAFTIDMDLIEGVTSVVLDSNDTDGANTYDLDDLNAAQAGAISIQGVAGTANGTTLNLDMKDGSGTADAAVVTASVATGNTVTIGDDNGDIESLTVAMNGGVNATLAIAVGDFAGSTSADGSITVTGGAAGKTLTVSNAITADTLDMSGVKSDTTVTMGVVDATITGGTADDDVTFGTTLSSGDSFDGGEGNDRAIIDPAASVSVAPTFTNVEELEIGATGTVTVNLTGSVVPEIVLQAQDGVANVVTLTNAGGITNITMDGGAADSDDDFNGVTLSGTGYAGTADAMTISATADTDAVDTGAFTLTGIEDLTISVTGDGDDENFTIATGVTGSSLNNVTVTSSGYGASSTTVDVVLNTITSGTAGTNEMLSFDASGVNTGFSVVLDSMQAGSTVSGSAFYDTISVAGSAAGVIVNAGAGNDTLTASATVGSTLNGEAGADTLNGGTGADVLSGGAGNDTFDGGAANDTISGGTGVDTFIADFDGEGEDTITDFTAGVGGDIVDLDGTDDVTNTTNADAFALIQAAGAVELINGLSVIDNGLTTVGNATSLSDANVATYLADVNGATAGTWAITSDASNAKQYIVVSDGTDSALFRHDSATDAVIDAGELTLMVTFSGISDAGTLTAANFADFV